MEGAAENKCFFTQLTSKYLLGVEAADLVGGVLGGGGAQGDGVAAGAAVLTGAGAVSGEAETAPVELELADLIGIIFPVIGRITSKRISSAELEEVAAATLDCILA